MTDVAAKNFTKEELAERRAAEKALEDFKPITLTPPSHLDSVAKKEFRRIIPLLKQLPIADLDLAMVTNYCQMYSACVEFDKEMNKNGRIIISYDDDGVEYERKINPAFNARLKASAELRSTCSQLGMTIDSRLKIVVPKTEEKYDPFAELMNDD
jgi:P27 family predicted phage terminase small subunit